MYFEVEIGKFWKIVEASYLYSCSEVVNVISGK